jgi:hypothetical protein
VDLKGEEMMGPIREEREEKEELHSLQISASNVKVLVIGK